MCIKVDSPQVLGVQLDDPAVKARQLKNKWQNAFELTDFFYRMSWPLLYLEYWPSTTIDPSHGW